MELHYHDPESFRYSLNSFIRASCVEYEVESEDVPGELILDRSTRAYLPLLPSLGFVWQF